MSATTPEKTTVWRAKCHACDAITFADHDTAAQYWAGNSRWYSFLPCRLCEKWRPAATVSGKRGNRPCGPWCTSGTGSRCTCQCGGANHGSDYPPGLLWMLK